MTPSVGMNSVHILKHVCTQQCPWWFSLLSVMSNMLSVSPFLATGTRFSLLYCGCWRCQSIQVSEWQGKATGSICASCFSDKTKQSMSLNCVIISAISWSHLRTSSKIVQNAKNSSSCLEKQLNGCWQPGCMLVLVVGSGLVGRDRKSGLGRNSG